MRICHGKVKFDPVKAHDVLLHAFALLRARISDATLVLVGADGPTLEKTRSQADDLGLSGSVEFHVDVPHEQLPGFMARASLLVLPSRSEACPLVLLEAGAAKLPVIASRVGGVPEMLEHGTTALLIPPDNPHALANAIQALLLDTVLADRLSQAWYARVVERWSWSRTRQRYLDLIAGLQEPQTRPIMADLAPSIPSQRA